ncbi:MAG: HpcH HpaI protein [Dehalococcoidia bacterium]|nr:HpcH HpaI protein [Dehalococcoidia bacterium]
MELLRSLLFVPGNRRDMLEKAIALPADVLVPDMEDSVPLSEKAAARRVISDALPRLAQGGRRVVVRVNALETGLLEEDMEAAVTPHTYGINVGKVDGAWDVQEVDRVLTRLEARRGLERGRLRLILWIESAMAVLNAHPIASASRRVIAVVFGAEDYTEDMGIERTEGSTEVYVPRAMVAMAARAAGVVPLDIVYPNFRDEEGLRRDIQVGRSLGFRGKFAIHPSQLQPINTMFSPLPQEVEDARRVLRAFQEAEAQGRGSTSLDGRMIDIPIAKRARNLVALAEAIAEREASERGKGE